MTVATFNAIGELVKVCGADVIFLEEVLYGTNHRRINGMVVWRIFLESIWLQNCGQNTYWKAHGHIPLWRPRGRYIAGVQAEY